MAALIGERGGTRPPEEKKAGASVSSSQGQPYIFSPQKGVTSPWGGKRKDACLLQRRKKEGDPLFRDELLPPVRSQERKRDRSKVKWSRKRRRKIRTRFRKRKHRPRFFLQGGGRL